MGQPRIQTRTFLGEPGGTFTLSYTNNNCNSSSNSNHSVFLITYHVPSPGPIISFDSHNFSVKLCHYSQFAVEEMELREVETFSEDHTARRV